MTQDDIIAQMGRELRETNFGIGELYSGKVRDNYKVGGKIIMVATDRISAFDHILGVIPYKGQLLTQMAVYWFEATRDIVRNHIIEVPDPNVMIVKAVKGLPVEMVVRGYITGSLWREYAEGGRGMYGIPFPEGLKKQQKLETPIITPSTKAEYGQHDLPITRDEIISGKLVDPDIYSELERIALALFARGQEMANEQGLILVDTKYEFGLDQGGNIVLMDEIHTPDSSRYWYLADYEAKFSSGSDQVELNKEHLRAWLINRGFSGHGKPPELSKEIIVEAALKYIEAFELITGHSFEARPGPVEPRIRKNLIEAGYMK